MGDNNSEEADDFDEHAGTNSINGLFHLPVIQGEKTRLAKPLATDEKYSPGLDSISNVVS